MIQYLKEQHPDRLDQIFETLRRRVPRLETVEAEPMQDGRLLLQIKDAPFDRPVMSRYVSDGTLKMLSYLVVLMDPDPPQFIGIEEPSMEAALRVLLPRVLGDLTYQVYPHQCKDDLLNRLPNRLRGYSAWLPDNYRIVVVVDRDDNDCLALKQRLEQMANAAGLRSRSNADGQPYQVVNRLAIEELGAWYFGDWDAVRAAYPRVPGTIPSKAKYRDPDAITGGTWEAFERVLQSAGYFRTGLRKIEAARAVAEHWDPKASRSDSFRVFRDVLLEMIDG